jgi:hypothetical protein
MEHIDADVHLVFQAISLHTSQSMYQTKKVVDSQFV